MIKMDGVSNLNVVEPAVVTTFKYLITCESKNVELVVEVERGFVVSAKHTYSSNTEVVSLKGKKIKGMGLMEFINALEVSLYSQVKRKLITE